MGLALEAEQPLADDVALDLSGATADSEGPAEEKGPVPGVGFFGVFVLAHVASIGRLDNRLYPGAASADEGGFERVAHGWLVSGAG